MDRDYETQKKAGIPSIEFALDFQRSIYTGYRWSVTRRSTCGTSKKIWKRISRNNFNKKQRKSILIHFLTNWEEFQKNSHMT